MKWKIHSLPGLLALFFLFTCNNNTASNQSAPPKEQGSLTNKEREAVLEKGAGITSATFAALSGQLRNALQKEGVAGAVKYCNLVAYPLVDSLSRVHGAAIRRTSLKVRNPEDKPTDAELAVLQEYHTLAEAGEPLQPAVRAIDASTVAYYAPIQTQELCLKCHGIPGETIKEDDYAIIRQLYPEDEAIGYQAGDLRGMWSVRLKRD
ncbi:MAG: DUF3365 domain-containing protein [Lewinellaceae bacterium]|nr:DUF3365 domain-containing protein [Lewinellaceae bacterium]MCB9289700.1 DUF3365 domain-containing protein [Lewinellaceae bacterium]